MAIRTNLALLVACSCLFAGLTAAVAAEGDEAQIRKTLTGQWKGFAVAGKGEKPDTGPVKLELTFSDKSIHGVEIKGEGPVDHGTGDYTLKLDSEPRQLDAAKMRGNRKQEWLGIYKIQDGALWWCVSGKVRPTSFETVKGQFLLILRQPAAK